MTTECEIMKVKTVRNQFDKLRKEFSELREHQRSKGVLTLKMQAVNKKRIIPLCTLWSQLAPKMQIEFSEKDSKLICVACGEVARDNVQISDKWMPVCWSCSRQTEEFPQAAICPNCRKNEASCGISWNEPGGPFGTFSGEGILCDECAVEYKEENTPTGSSRKWRIGNQIRTHMSIPITPDEALAFVEALQKSKTAQGVVVKNKTITTFGLGEIK